MNFAERYAFAATTINLLFAIIGVIVRNSAKWGAVFGVAVLLYVVIRMRITKRVSIRTAGPGITFSLAPLRVWLEHFSYYGMLTYVVVVTNFGIIQRTRILGSLMIALACILLLICVFPIWAYVLYRRRIAMN